MACTEYDDEAEPLTVFHQSGNCCEGTGGDVTNYDPPQQGSELTLEGSLSLNVIPVVAGAVMPSGIVLPGASLAGSIGPSGALAASGEAYIASITPWAWFDSSDPNGTNGPIGTRYSGVANGANMDAWNDRSGNGRHWPYDTTVNRKPKFWKVANSGTGSPVNLPNSGLPVVGTVDAGSGVLVFGDMTGGTPTWNLGTGSFTIYIAGRKVDPTGIIGYLGSQNAGGIGDECMFVGPDDSGAPDSAFIRYRTNPTGVPHRYSRAINAITSNNYWRWSFQRESGVAHHIWQHSTELTTPGASGAGSPLDQNFLVQYLLKTMNNAGAFTHFQNHMCEVLIFTAAHNAAVRNSVWIYLDDKWGLS